MSRRPVLTALLMVVLTGCAPRLRPLEGRVTPATIPATNLAPGHHQLSFEWEYADPDMNGRGDGAVRVAAPDSARLDFFLAGGMASGAAVLIADSLQIPGGDFVRRLIPPPTLLWATLGRVVLPVTRDTAIRRDEDLLRADIGLPVQWRATFRGDTLVRLEHIEHGRVVEWVDRTEENRVEYRQEQAKRSLKLRITAVYEVRGFDAAIWRIDR